MKHTLLRVPVSYSYKFKMKKVQLNEPFIYSKPDEVVTDEILFHDQWLTQNFVT